MAWHPLAPAGRFGRRHRVGKSAQVRAILRRGRRKTGDHLQLALLPRPPAQAQSVKPEHASPEHPKPEHPKPEHRCAVAVAKAVGNAPARARMRRLLRVAFRCVRGDFAVPCDWLLTVRAPWPAASAQEVAAELARLAAKVGAAAGPKQHHGLANPS